VCGKYKNKIMHGKVYVGRELPKSEKKNPYFEGRIVLLVFIFPFDLYILFYFANLFICLILN